MTNINTKIDIKPINETYYLLHNNAKSYLQK